MLRDRGDISLLCAWCGFGFDKANHIFHECLLAWGFESFFVGFYRQWWLVGCTIVLWPLWLARNKDVFNKKFLTLDEMCFLLKFSMFYWVNANLLDYIFYESQWWCFPLKCSFPLKDRFMHMGVAWSHMVIGALNFNVDGCARGKSGLASCGGMLCDGEYCILAFYLETSWDF
ncbi:hypothetical protein GQ457_15G016660 [Hibiscus cannabinus]